MTAHSAPHRRLAVRHADRSRRLVQAVVALLLVGVLAAACSGDSADVSTSSSDSFDGAAEAPAVEVDVAERAFDGDDEAGFEPEEAPADSVDSAGGSNAGATTTGSAGGQPTAQLPDLGRDIIYTASLELASADVSAATREAIRTVEARGGFLFSQETRGGAGGSSVLTFKVLPDQFQAVLNDLGSIGTVRSQSISADDVTAVVVDLESRISTAAASVERLRDLLEDASELETIATLENQLLQRETTLEQLRGQLRTVRNQVDLATITVVVTELLNRPGISLEVMSFEGHDGGFGCFDALASQAGEGGDPMTLCYRITNTGDTPLVDLTLDEPVLGLSIGSLVVVDGQPANVVQLDPGESITLAYEFELDEPFRIRSSISATGLDADGNPIDAEILATARRLRFHVTDLDDGFPSFGEVLGDSWNALVTAALVVALVAVAVAPFLAVALLLGLPLWWWLRRRRADRPAPTAVPAPVPGAHPAPDDAPAGPAAVQAAGPTGAPGDATRNEPPTTVTE